MASKKYESSKGYKTTEDCYHQVIASLTEAGKIKDISSHLLKLTTNHERVLYLYNILKDMAFLPPVKKTHKDDDVSVYYRNQGNQYFQQHKDFEALQCYNLALLYAPTTSENFILAVSNRSAALFSMKKFKECLEDIDFIFNRECPEKLIAKLTKKKQTCQLFLETSKPKNKKNDNIMDEKIAEIMKFKGARHEKYVCASNKLKVVYTEEMGRHVIAIEDIAVGEILAQEDPYLVVLLKSQLPFSCAFCTSRKFNLYPCPSCTYSLYCSVECRENAYKQYHSVECKIMPSVLELEFTKIDWLALRTTIKSRTDQKNWSDTIKAAQEADSRMNTDLWGCVEVNNKWVFDSKYYPSVHTLASNVDKRSISDIFRKSLETAIFIHLLTVTEFVKEDDSESFENVKNYVTGTLLHHMMTSPTNMHGLRTNIENGFGSFIDEYNIASGVYAFHSLLNHSCSPNVVRYNATGTAQMSLIAIRPIMKGMQIFDNYGNHYAIETLPERQANLRFQYKFICKCEACMNNWPLHIHLRPATGIPQALHYKTNKCLTTKVTNKLMKGDKDTAIKIYKDLCEFIESYEKYVPCQELGECQETLKQCFAIFEGVLPYIYSREVDWKAFPPVEATGGKPKSPEYISGPTL